LPESVKSKDHFENLGIGSKIIVKWVLKKHHSFASRYGPVTGSYEYNSKPSNFNETWLNYLPVERL
jgi:hypothetical protein